MHRLVRAALRLLITALVSVAVGYLAICAVMAWKKDALIFVDHGRAAAVGGVAPSGYETWWQPMRDGARVEAWWRPAPGASAAAPAPAVIVFHGNADLIDRVTAYADRWHALGAHVLLVEYRGYGRSEGTPNIDAIRADSREWFDRVAATPGVRADLILAHGFSLGGVFAMELAADRPVAALATESAPASLRASARDRFVWLLLTRERFDGEAALRRLAPDLPVLITHGRADSSVPVHHARLLAASRPGARLEIGDHGHEAIALGRRPEWLAELLAAARARADASAARDVSSATARTAAPADKTLASPAPGSAR